MISHAKLSASGSHRWVACPGSVKAEEGIIEKSSIFAAEGTAAHELAELCLTTGKCASDFVGIALPENNATTVEPDMASYIQQYVDYVSMTKGDKMIEQRVDFSHLVPGGFGTCDAIVISGDTMHVVDLKYGKGVRIDAEGNTQGLLYALGALNDYGMIYDIQTVTISIVQPRLDHISEWTITKEELDAWGKQLAASARAALADNAPRLPTEKACQWCKAKATCAALKKLTEDTLLCDFDTLDSPNPDTLDDDALRAAMDAKKLIVSWLDAVEVVVKDRLESGQGFPGYKLVEGRSVRSWRDEAAATDALVEALGADAFEPQKLLSVAKAEKQLGKAKASVLDGLILKPTGAPTLAQESDPRPSICVSEKDFDTI